MKSTLRTISMPPEMQEQIFAVASERAKRGELGGFSAAARELMLAELARRERRRKPATKQESAS